MRFKPSVDENDIIHDPEFRHGGRGARDGIRRFPGLKFVELFHSPVPLFTDVNDATFVLRCGKYLGKGKKLFIGK